MAVRSLTDLPLDVPPNRNDHPLPTRFWGLSREQKSPENLLNLYTSEKSINNILVVHRDSLLNAECVECRVR
jgi:hypothetical protein